MKLIVSHGLYPEINIKITLLDNPVIKGWFNKCYLLQKEHKFSGVIYQKDVGIRRPWAVDVITNRYENLKKVVEELKTFELPIPVNIPHVPEIFNKDLHWCNQMHNVFVELVMHLNKFTIEKRNKRLCELVHDINYLVHNLEHNTYLTDTEQHVLTYSSHCYIQTMLEHSTTDMWFDISPEDQLKYHSTIGDTLYPVTFANTILGKTLLISFLQEEDPMSVSVSGINGNWGNIEIVLDNQRSTIYQSKEFLNWVRQTKFKHIPLEFPVGTIDNPNMTPIFYKICKSIDNKFVYTFIE